jgi:hypothetical protein
MTSEIKVNTIKKNSGSTITIGEAGNSIVNNGLNVTPQGTSSSPITFTVTVATKTSANVYNGQGDSDAYFINGTEAPSFFIDGNVVSSYQYVYRFDQSDNSNTGHPLRFYLDDGKTQIYSTNVATNGTPGQAGAYTQITVGGNTPNVLYYQSSSNSFMGNRIFNPAARTLNTGGAGLYLPTGTGSANQFIGYGSVSNGISELAWATPPGETKPTISSISPTVITNDATNVTINGSNYLSVPIVEAINSTGAITAANSITFNSASQLVANFTLATDGTYFLRIENNDGNAVRSGSALLTVSDVPAWTTAAGSLGTVDSGGSISFTVAATDATSYAVTSGSMPGGASLNASTGAITGTESGSTGTTTYNFTITATDAQAQTAARAFSITVNHGIQNAMRFDGN